MQTMLAFILTSIIVAGTAVAQSKPCQPGRHARVPAIAELTYRAARKKLLAAGWQPLPTRSVSTGKSNPDISFGNGPLFWRRGYFELEFCSGTGVAACSFLFTDVYGNRLRVETAGEEVPKRYSAKVSGFRFVCD
jgi:hypothetical protein